MRWCKTVSYCIRLIVLVLEIYIVKKKYKEFNRMFGRQVEQKCYHFLSRYRFRPGTLEGGKPQADARFTGRSHVFKWDIKVAANLRCLLWNIKLNYKNMRGM